MAKNASCAECVYDEELCKCRGCKDVSGCSISTYDDGTCKYFLTEPFW